MSAAAPPGGGFSLFPSTGRPPSRTQATRPPASALQQAHDTAAGPAAAVPAAAIGEAVTAEVRIPAPVADVQTRRGDNVHDPARNNSVRSRSSIAKVRLSLYDDSPPETDDPPPPMPGQAADLAEQQQQHQLQAHSQPQHQPQPQPQPQQQQRQHHQQQQQHEQHEQQPPHRPPALRSIFPQYNPEIPLDQQDYFPTQTSPTRIPRGIISRPLYSPVSPTTAHAQQQQQQQQQHGQQLHPSSLEPIHTQAPATVGASVVSPLSAGVASPGAVSAATATTAAGPVAPYHNNRSSSSNGGWPTSAGAAAAAAAAAAARTGAGAPAAPTLPVPSSSEELRNFWKVANGWKAGPSEGRVFCLRMSCDKDAPVYRLSSAGQLPFYRLRLDPTSMSAYVTLSRHDPARPFKAESSKGGSGAGSSRRRSGDGSGSGSDGADAPNSSRDSVLDMAGAARGSVLLGGGGGGGSGVLGSGSSAAGGGGAAAAAANPHARFDSSKNWQVAMTTTLEEEARRHQPQDGLVALLYPAAAARMAIERQHDAAMVMTAERECARLVWDDDSGNFFLVHPALALPFCVTIERSTTWSRTAYTLEHLESPQHLARLTRDGTGAGYLEVDTGIASKIDAVYLVDVAVAALVLVAHADGQFSQVEQFAPPPLLPPAAALLGGGHADGAGGLGGGGSGAARGSLVNLVLGGVTGGDGGRSGSRLSHGHGGGSGGGGGGGGRRGFFGGGKKTKKGKPGRSRMEELDLDLESQTSIDLSAKMYEMAPVGGGGGGGASGRKTKRRAKKDEDKMPGCLRLLTALFKCCFWCVAMCVRAVLAILRGLFKCITSEKL